MGLCCCEWGEEEANDKLGAKRSEIETIFAQRGNAFQIFPLLQIHPLTMIFQSTKPSHQFQAQVIIQTRANKVWNKLVFSIKFSFVAHGKSINFIEWAKFGLASNKTGQRIRTLVIRFFARCLEAASFWSRTFQ